MKETPARFVSNPSSGRFFLYGLENLGFLVEWGVTVDLGDEASQHHFYGSLGRPPLLLLMTPSPISQLLVGLSFLRAAPTVPAQMLMAQYSLPGTTTSTIVLREPIPSPLTPSVPQDAATPGTTICISSGIWQEEISVSKPDVHLRGLDLREPSLNRGIPSAILGTPRPLWSKLLLGVSLEGVQLRGAQTGLRSPMRATPVFAMCSFAPTPSVSTGPSWA